MQAVFYHSQEGHIVTNQSFLFFLQTICQNDWEATEHLELLVLLFLDHLYS